MSEISLSETQLRVANAVGDAIISPLGVTELRKLLPDASEADLELVATTPPSSFPGFHKGLLKSLSFVPPAKVRQLKAILTLLGTRVACFPLTGTVCPVTELSLHDRWQFFTSLKEARLAQFKMLYRSLFDLFMVSYIFASPEITRAFGYVEPNPVIARLADLDLFVPSLKTVPNSLGDGTPTHLDCDVVLVGSGSAAGVAAYRLTKQGYKVLILEKARYVHPSDLGSNDLAREEVVFENQGKLVSTDASITVLAGSTVGGGAAVNWSCSLATPQGVRQEWVDKGVPFYGTTVYDDATDFVQEVMGVTCDVGPQSFTNNLILEGARKLDWKAKVCPQNTGKHLPNNRFHGWGYRFGDKGGVVNWLHYALTHGAELIDEAAVLKIRHDGTKATGVEVLVKEKDRLIVHARKVVSCCGSLQTPGLLIRSGFRNKHIGKGLKLHPVSVVYGDFGDTVVNKPDDTIMTAVSTQIDNLDGHFHGPKIEAIHHTPHLLGKFLPWHNGDQYSRLLTRYQHLSALLVITRDRTNGRVWVDKSQPMSVRLDYTTNQYDLWAIHQGCLAGADLLYIQGAQRVIMPLDSIPEFESSRPTSERRLRDADYQEWRQNAAKQTFINYRVGIGSAHQMASCRMSNKGPGHSAVDERGRLHECKNVHVIDTSVFPSASGVNPMISCMATAYVLSGYLIEELERDAGRPRL